MNNYWFLPQIFEKSHTKRCLNGSRTCPFIQTSVDLYTSMYSAFNGKNRKFDSKVQIFIIRNELMKTICTPPLLLTACLHHLRHTKYPALLEQRFLIRKADRGSDDEVEFNSNFISNLKRKDLKRKRKNSAHTLQVNPSAWGNFTDALKRRRIMTEPDFIELTAY